MDVLEVLQTVALCVGALALAVIAFVLALVMLSFAPSGDLRDSEEVEPIILFPPEPVRRRGRKRAKGSPPPDQKSDGV